MAQYVNPVTVLDQCGERLPTTDYAEARRKAGARLLVVRLDLLIFKNARVIDSPAEWADCYDQYRTGHSLDFSPFAVAPDALQQAGATVR